MTATVIAFVSCPGGFVLLGVLSQRYSRGTSSDGLVASSSVPIWVAHHQRFEETQADSGQLIEYEYAGSIAGYRTWNIA